MLSYWGCWGSHPAGLQLEGDRCLHTGGWPLGESPSWPSGLEGVVRHTVVVVTAKCDAVGRVVVVVSRHLLYRMMLMLPCGSCGVPWWHTQVWSLGVYPS